MAPRRDEENKMYGCMMLPVQLHRVHAPEDDPKAASSGDPGVGGVCFVAATRVAST